MAHLLGRKNKATASGGGTFTFYFCLEIYSFAKNLKVTPKLKALE
jgi:hypothetical protein